MYFNCLLLLSTLYVIATTEKQQADRSGRKSLKKQP